MISDHFPVITGIGAISAAGENFPELWQNVLTGKITTACQSLGKNNIRIPVYAASTPCFFGDDQRLVRRADRSVLLALAAAREAWHASGLDMASYEPSRVGVMVGSSRGPAAFCEKAILQKIKCPSAPVYGTFSSVAGVVSDTLHTEGSAFMTSSTCTSAATALQLAEQMIRSGVLDVAVVGGVDAPLVDFVLEQYLTAGVLSKNDRLMPFDQHRSGTLLGEGAAFLILESKKFAEVRNASILAELQAIALRSYTKQRASLDRQGSSLQKVIQASLQEAALLPDDIELLHLHGTGTKLNDLIEGRAIEAIFGEPAHQPFSWATKAITGHTLGASSLFQVVLAVQALRSELILETANCRHLDSACRLRLHHGSPITQPLTHALCLTSGFWGNVSAIILKK